MSDGKSMLPLALVTGVNGGLGTAIANSLQEGGVKVVGCDLQRHQAEGISDISYYESDVSRSAAVQELYQCLLSDEGRPPDILINNAGVQSWSSFLNVADDEWDRVIQTNLTGCFMHIREFAKLRESNGGGGVVVNIGSGCNHRAFPELVAYTASKGGIEMLTKSAASELGHLGIRVNCLAPGAIATDRTAAEASDYSGRWSQLTPLGRVGTPEDVAAAVHWLLDDRAAFVTGQTIGVDGGLFCRAPWPGQYHADVLQD